MLTAHCPYEKSWIHQKPTMMGSLSHAEEKLISFFGHHVATSVQICIFEAQKFAHLRVILGDFPDTKHQELPRASKGLKKIFFFFGNPCI